MSNINACTTKTMTDAGAATEGSLPQESMAVPQQPAQTASDVDSSKSGAQEAEMKQGQLDVALVERVREMAVFDSESNQCSFGELIDAKQGEKCLVIFISLCQSYLKHLTDVATPQQFADANVRVSVIGHGDSAVIKSYAEVLKLPWKIYAQPSKDLHKAFGMTSTLDAGKQKPDYQTSSSFSNIIGSISNAFKIGGQLTGGAISQNGGEQIWEPGFKCTFFHNMANTRDHTPVVELLTKLGVKS